MSTTPSEVEAGERPGYPHLLDGRRVRIADLLHAGLLQDGESLVFERKRSREMHRASITASSGGGIVLEDGREFRSPSRAASAAVGYGTFDGWHAWCLSDGRTLDGPRQELLDQAAEGQRADAREEIPSPPSATERRARLRDARQRAEDGAPLTLSVRDLLGWWGATGRGAIKDQIDADLANHSLITSPGFNQVSLDALVQLLPVPEEPDGSPNQLPVPTSALGASSEEQPAREAALTVGTLPSAMGGVVSVKPTASFDEAITEMLINDFSQLPVLKNPYTVTGAVTWKSIAQVRHRSPAASLEQAIVAVREVGYDHDLIDILPALAESDFVLVRGPKNAVAGIVTASDVAVAYGNLASPFFLVGELDQRLRAVIDEYFELADVIPLCDPDGERKLSSFDSLSIGDYLRILQNTDCWAKLQWPLDRRVFTQRLDEIRKIRNDLMHFNPDPVPVDAVDKIRNMISLLRNYTD